MSGSSRYNLAIKGVCKQFVVLETSEYGSFRTSKGLYQEEKNVVFSVRCLDDHLVNSLRVSARLVSALPFVENKSHIHILSVLGPSHLRRFPAACIAEERQREREINTEEGNANRSGISFSFSQGSFESRVFIEN